MDLDELREAARLQGRIKELDRLADKYLQMDVGFVEYDRVRTIGSNELDSTERDNIKYAMRNAVAQWFNEKRRLYLEALKQLGVNIGSQEKTTYAWRHPYHDGLDQAAE